MKRIGLALIAAACLVGPGCASVFHRPHFVKIRAINVQASAEPREAAKSAYYMSAVRAIDQRDYAFALDMLQAARAANPQDAAVLNAFGVVYDKLGRFDLSARYYTQAAALDPDSPIVKQNLAYSARLQGKVLADAPATALAAATPAAPLALAQAKPAPAAPALLGAPPPAAVARPAFTIASAPAPSVVITTAPNGALITGRALAILDASGAAGGGEQVRQQLASRGWTAPKTSMQLAKVEARTRIVFPQGGLAVAQALARTLPFPAELAACDDRCTGISLIVGQDAADHLRAHS